MAIDYWALTKDFEVGDFVQKFAPARRGELFPYYGRVLAVMPGIGFVDVQWPFGASRESPEDLVKIAPEMHQLMPPSIDFGYYGGLDTKRKTATKGSRIWRTTEVPPGFHSELAKLAHGGVGEVRAYDNLWHRFASYSDGEAIRDEVEKFYRASRNLGRMFEQSWVERTATYWSAQGRKHRATRPEVESRRPLCPRCKGEMRKTTYKMEEARRVPLFACPSCLFIIKRDDILGPDGAPVGW